jgi:hypothetical protein
LFSILLQEANVATTDNLAKSIFVYDEWENSEASGKRADVTQGLGIFNAAQLIQ